MCEGTPHCHLLSLSSRPCKAHASPSCILQAECMMCSCMVPQRPELLVHAPLACRVHGTSMMAHLLDFGLANLHVQDVGQCILHVSVALLAGTVRPTAAAAAVSIVAALAAARCEAWLRAAHSWRCMRWLTCYAARECLLTAAAGTRTSAQRIRRAEQPHRQRCVLRLQLLRVLLQQFGVRWRNQNCVCNS